MSDIVVTYVLIINESFFIRVISVMPIPVAEPSKASVCGRSSAGIAGSNNAGAWMFVCFKCCVLSGRGLCDEPITHPVPSVVCSCV